MTVASIKCDIIFAGLHRRPGIICRWGLAGLVCLLISSCATAPPPEKRSWKVGHEDLVYVAGGDMGLGRNSESDWVRLPALRAWGEVYYRYNLGGFYALQKTFFTPEAGSDANPDDHHVRRTSHAFGPVYTVALANWIDASVRLGLSYHSFALMERQNNYGSVCTSYGSGNNSCDDSFKEVESDGSVGYVATVRLLFPVWYWKPGLSLSLEYYGGPDFQGKLHDADAGYAFMAMLDLLAFSSEKRPWEYPPP